MTLLADMLDDKEMVSSLPEAPPDAVRPCCEHLRCAKNQRTWMGEAMVRFALIALVVGMLVPQAAQARWELRQEYVDGKMTLAGVSAESQMMPVGLRDTGTATLNVSCIPSSDTLWMQLIWPERMTYSPTISMVRSIENFPDTPQTWGADTSDGGSQSFTLAGETLPGSELMNRLLTSKGKTIAFRPQGIGRIQDAIFQLDDLEAKLREVTKACPKWSYFDKMGLKK